MLVLSRKIGEQIVVPGCELAITVLAVKGKMVRLGITAPAGVDVYREEVWERIDRSTDPPLPDNPGPANLPGELLGLALTDPRPK
jgi:carbon storage regulator